MATCDVCRRSRGSAILSLVPPLCGWFLGHTTFGFGRQETETGEKSYHYHSTLWRKSQTLGPRSRYANVRSVRESPTSADTPAGASQRQLESSHIAVASLTVCAWKQQESSPLFLTALSANSII